MTDHNPNPADERAPNIDDPNAESGGPTDDERAENAEDLAAGAERPSSVASAEENAALEHTQGGITTRQDATDAGVPMLPGDPNEPIGPEDAMGPGPTRGDYSGRTHMGPHLTSEVIPPNERQDVELKNEDGDVIGVEPGPRTRLVDLDARAGVTGDEPGKGGVPGTQPREAV